MSKNTDIFPSSLTELKPIVKDFIEKLESLEHEIELLNEQRKELFEEYETKIDIKELKAALRVHKIMKKVSHKDAFESYCVILEGDS